MRAESWRRLRSYLCKGLVEEHAQAGGTARAKALRCVWATAGALVWLERREGGGGEVRERSGQLRKIFLSVTIFK